MVLMNKTGCNEPVILASRVHHVRIHDQGACYVGFVERVKAKNNVNSNQYPGQAHRMKKQPASITKLSLDSYMDHNAFLNCFFNRFDTSSIASS